MRRTTPWEEPGSRTDTRGRTSILKGTILVVGGVRMLRGHHSCSCDVPSHTYTFSWEGNPHWSRVYVGSEELYEYFIGRSKAYGVPDFLRLEHRVIEARWNEATGQYNVTIEDLSTGKILNDSAEVVINATGIFKYVRGASNAERHSGLVNS